MPKLETEALARFMIENLSIPDMAAAMVIRLRCYQLPE